MSAAIKAVNFADLRLRLAAATAEELEATATYWRDRPGVIAGEHRRLVWQEIEFRLAIQHDIETAHAALVAEMAPTARWEAQK